MQKFAKSISEFVQETEEAENDFADRPACEAALQKAAETWAVFCLRNFRDELLGKGMQLSRSITDFLDQLHIDAMNAANKQR